MVVATLAKKVMRRIFIIQIHLFICLLIQEIFTCVKL